MKDTILKNIDTAVTGAGAASFSSIMTSQQVEPMIPIIVGLLAPVVKEVAMYAIDKLTQRIRKNRKKLSNENQ